MAGLDDTTAVGAAPLDVKAIKADFPLLNHDFGRPMVYLDSAASSQRPQSVLDTMDTYYESTHANVHRGVYAIAEEATRQFEAARLSVGRFVNAPNPASEIIFTKNVTEAINLVAYSWGRQNLHEGDAIVLSEMEHHANLVPWMMLAKERGVELRYIRLGDDYRLNLSNLDALVDGAKLVWAHSSCRIAASISQSLASTSTASRATRCLARPESACSGDVKSCSRPCPPSWVGVR
jgi:cysteine desulfurase/selenocysteine lyase